MSTDRQGFLLFDKKEYNNELVLSDLDDFP